MKVVNVQVGCVYNSLYVLSRLLDAIVSGCCQCCIDSCICFLHTQIVWYVVFSTFSPATQSDQSLSYTFSSFYTCVFFLSCWLSLWISTHLVFIYCWEMRFSMVFSSHKSWGYNVKCYFIHIWVGVMYTLHGFSTIFHSDTLMKQTEIDPTGTVSFTH